MMVWPDGGIGRPHKHPFWSKCQHCAAAPGWQQELSLFIAIMIIPLSLLGLLFFLAKGVAGQ
jgi:hypothetical protein